jgi:hypothetical protein
MDEASTRSWWFGSRRDGAEGPGSRRSRASGRAARVTLVALASAALGTAVCAAPAGAATLGAPTVSPSVVEQGIAAQLTFTGTADPGADSAIFAVARPAGGPACQSTFQADQRLAASSQIIADPTVNPTDEQPGNFTTTVGWQPNELPGSVIVCSWLDQGGSETAAPALTVNVTGPQASATIAPVGTPVDGSPFTLRLSAVADQPLALYAVFHDPTQSCSASFAIDRQAFASDTKLVTAQALPAGTTSSAPTATLPAGTYVICTWLEGPLSDEVAFAGVSPAFTVASASPYAGLPNPALTISSLTASATGGVHVSGTTAPGFVGTLAVEADCGKSSTGSASASGGGYSATLALPTNCSAGDQLTITVSVAKSPTWLAGSIGETTLVSGPTPRTHVVSPLTAFASIQRHGRSLKNVFLTRPGTILVASSLHLTLSLHWSGWTSHIARGSGIARAARVRPYRVTVTASHPVHDTFACLDVSHRVRGRLHTLHLGLGREGRGLVWIPVRRLHAKNSRATVYGAPHGCPVPKG